MSTGALDLIAQPVGIDDLATVVSNEDAIDLDPAIRPIDRHIGDDPHIGAYQLVLGVGYAASARELAIIARTRSARLPARESPQALEQFEPAMISEMASADLERVDTCFSGNLVKKALVTEGVLQSGRRTYPRRRERRVDEPMRGQLCCWSGRTERPDPDCRCQPPIPTSAASRERLQAASHQNAASVVH